jgi:16S rRNA (guanine527-N7)-methyltransferase
LLPLVRLGGIALAMKGPDVAEELREAEQACRLLGAGAARTQSYRLPEAGDRTLVVIPKVAATPDAYPRRPGMPAKRPL